MELYQMLPGFRMESLERIESMRGSLLHLEHTPGCYAATSNLFCAIHALEESACLFGLNDVVDLARAMENVLVRMNRNEVQPDEPLITLLLSCCAHMRVMIRQTGSEWVCRPHWESEASEDDLLEQLKDIGSASSLNIKSSPALMWHIT